MKIWLCGLLSSLLLLGTTSTAWAQDDKGQEQTTVKAAVMPLQSDSLKAQTLKLLDGIVVAIIDAEEGYSVLSIADINAMLDMEQLKDAAGCTDVACAAELGGALGARYFVTGTVGILGEEVVVQLTMIDTKTSSVKARGQAIMAAKEQNYRRVVEQAVHRLLGRKTPADVADMMPVAQAQAPKRTTDARAGQSNEIHGNQESSKARFVFQTPQSDHAFSITIIDAQGGTHRCPSPIGIGAPCTFTALPLGKTQLTVTSPKLHAFSDGFTVRDESKTHAIAVSSMPSDGSIISWGLGGSFMFVGSALIGVGAGTDLPTTGPGIGVALAGAVGVGLGFLFDSRVEVNYPGIDAFF